MTTYAIETSQRDYEILHDNCGLHATRNKHQTGLTMPVEIINGKPGKILRFLRQRQAVEYAIFAAGWCGASRSDNTVPIINLLF